jgi:hypothetical protein
MAISNYDSIISARSSGQYTDPFCIKSESITPLAAGHWVSMINMGGTPSSVLGSLTSAAGGVALNSTHAGAIPISTQSTALGQYLLTAGCGAQGIGSLGCAMLVDVLWGISGISYTGATYEIASTALTRSTDGVGNQIMVVMQASHTSATNTTATVTYTNSDGTTGRVASVVVMTTLSRAHHIRPTGMPFVQLAAGDVGVKGVQKISFNATIGAGACQIYIVKPLLTIPIIGGGGYVEKDQTLQFEGMIRLNEGTDGKMPYLGWIASGVGAVANTVFYSQIRIVYG